MSPLVLLQWLRRRECDFEKEPPFAPLGHHDASPVVRVG